MGCDGGTIPTRGELVQKKKKEEKIEKKDSLNTKWRHCAMSQEPLQKPIVACELGRLFNKESIIKYLIDKSSGPSSSTGSTFSYIRNLKDVKELKLMKNPAHKGEVDKIGQGSRVAEYFCPISGLEMTGNYKFQYLWSCGCVFSERTLKEIRDGICLQCNAAYTADDVITLNGSTEEMEVLEKRMNERRIKNKRKKQAAPSTAAATASTSAASSTAADANNEGEPSCKLSKFDTAISALNNNGNINVENNITKLKSSTSSSSAAAATTKSNDNTKNNYKNAKSSSSKPSSTTTTSSSSSSKSSSGSIQNDPTASETFKSLFNTHQSAKNKPKPHWVSCNPLYY